MRLRQATYVRFFGRSRVGRIGMPNAFERTARRLAPMTGKAWLARILRRYDQPECRAAVVAGGGRAPRKRAVKIPQSCELSEHRSPPVPRVAVGQRANNDRLGAANNSLARDGAAIGFMLLRWRRARQPGNIVTKGATTHLFSVSGRNADDPLSTFSTR